MKMVARVIEENKRVEGSSVELSNGITSLRGRVAAESSNEFVVDWEDGARSVENKSDYELVVEAGKVDYGCPLCGHIENHDPEDGCDLCGCKSINNQQRYKNKNEHYHPDHPVQASRRVAQENPSYNPSGNKPVKKILDYMKETYKPSEDGYRTRDRFIDSVMYQTLHSNEKCGLCGQLGTVGLVTTDKHDPELGISMPDATPACSGCMDDKGHSFTSNRRVAQENPAQPAGWAVAPMDNNAYPDGEPIMTEMVKRQETAQWKDEHTRTFFDGENPAQAAGWAVPPASNQMVERSPVMAARVYAEDVSGSKGRVEIANGNLRVAGRILASDDESFIVEWEDERRTVEAKSDYDLIITADDSSNGSWCKKCGTELLGEDGPSLCGDCAGASVEEPREE